MGTPEGETYEYYKSLPLWKETYEDLPGTTLDKLVKGLDEDGLELLKVYI